MLSCVKSIITLILAILITNTQSAGQQQEGFSNYNGVSSYYQTFGSGEMTMLIINGGPGMDSNGFQSFAMALADQYCLKTVIYDQRGTGKSKLESVSSKNISMDLMVGDIEALRKSLRIDSWLVFGQSFGGMLASYYATKHPDRIQKMILSSSGGIDLTGLRELTILDRLTKEERDAYEYWDDRMQDSDTYENRFNRGVFLAHAYVVKEENILTIARRLTQGNVVVNELVFKDLYRIDFDCKPQLSSFNKPTLIIQGDQDVVSRQTAERAHAVLANSTLVFIKDSGHYGWLDNPQQYFDALGKFIMNSK